MEISHNYFRYLKYETARIPAKILVSGAGAQEMMRPCMVDRSGTGDRMLMFFYNPVILRIHGEDAQYPAHTLRLWGNDTPHYYGSLRGNWIHSWLHFHGDDIPEMLEEAGLEDEFCCPFGSPELLEQYLFMIYREMTAEREPDMRLLRGHLFSLFLEIARIRSRPAENLIPERWIRLRQYIENHAAEKLDLQMLSHIVNLSVPALCEGFRHYFGTAPIRFQLDCRMQIARSLLRDRNLPIKEIAFLCGYPDPFQFSRMFRRKFGTSPRMFR